MKRIHFPLLAIFFSVLLFSGCRNDETDDIQASKMNESEEITISIRSPKANTKSDPGYKLRYVAKLFKGQSSNAWASQPLQRKEIIEGEDNNNRISFKVDPNEYYAIMVFADYIPASSTPSAEGYYEDYFYDTNSSGKSVYVIQNPDGNASGLSSSFFNNDNYDCFYGIKTEIFKTEEEYNINLTLDRAAAKVIFRDNAELSGNLSITVNQLGVRPKFDCVNLSTSSTPNSEFTSKKYNTSLQSSPQDGNNDLFYFYTLATFSETPDVVSIVFTTKDDNGEKASTVTNIPVRANYRTIVTHDFIPEDQNSEIPGDDVTKTGDIQLNLSVNKNWNIQFLEN